MQPLPAPLHEPRSAQDQLPGLNRAPGAACLTDEELDLRISVGWEEWTELQEALLATGGMLPPPEVAARAAVFFAGPYRQASEAYCEALRRQFARVLPGSHNRYQRGRGLA